MLPFNKTIPAVVVAVIGFISGAYVFTGVLAEPERSSVHRATAGDVAIKAEDNSPAARAIKTGADGKSESNKSKQSTKPALGKLVNEQG